MQKLKNKLENMVRNFEKHVPLAVKAGVGALILYVGVLFYFLKAADTEARINNATVMVVRLTGGGGSGVSIYNSPNLSKVITNNHVCEAIMDGGKIRTASGKEHLISTVTRSRLHDICLITVQADLGVAAKVASKAQSKYASSSISGHPSLLPAVVSKGHVSSNQIISVFMGVRQCTQSEKRDPDSGVICFFFGGMPIIRTFDALLITAMIMPGSSGSAVYNDDGELAGLAFAGSQGLSYAYTVPYEYVSNFLENELKQLQPEIINYEVSLIDLLEAQSKAQNYYSHILSKCETAPAALTNICAIIKRDLTFRNVGASNAK